MTHDEYKQGKAIVRCPACRNLCWVPVDCGRLTARCGVCRSVWEWDSDGRRFPDDCALDKVVQVAVSVVRRLSDRSVDGLNRAAHLAGTTHLGPRYSMAMLPGLVMAVSYRLNGLDPIGPFPVKAIAPCRECGHLSDAMPDGGRTRPVCGACGLDLRPPPVKLQLPDLTAVWPHRIQRPGVSPDADGRRCGRTPLDDISPWQQNAVRALEGD